MVKILIFAHRGEAQAFFSQWDLHPVSFYFSGLFKNSDYFVLITGEGPKEASEKAVAVLSSFKNEISSVVNIGIAGSLSPKVKVGDLAWVRSSYAQNAERCEFKSYTTKHHTSTDCITAYSRVTTLEEKKTLSHFADLVDRELWSIASAAHLFKMDFLSLKLVSDESDTADFCQLVKEEAPILSKKLFDEFIKFENSHKIIAPVVLHAPKSNSAEDFILAHPKLYFTTSQARKLTTLLRGLFMKKIFTENEIKSYTEKTISESSQDITSKELSKILLNNLSEKLNPLNTAIKEKIQEAIFPLTETGALVGFDPELEQEYIQLNYQIRNTKDQKRLILALEQFNYQKIKDIFSGNLGE